MRLILQTVTVAGPKNIRAKKPNQDSVLEKKWQNHWLIVVCDGLGSKSYSGLGSKLACKAVAKVLSDISFDVPEKQVAKKIYEHWLYLLKCINIPSKKAATTCLFAWGDQSGNVRLFQLGDGVIAYQSQRFYILSENKSELFGNQTEALGVSTRWDDWFYREVSLDTMNDGIMLVTDGISDDVDDFEGLYFSLKRKNLRLNKRQSKKWIKYQLNHWATPHHVDDKSIGLMYWK